LYGGVVWAAGEGRSRQPGSVEVRGESQGHGSKRRKWLWWLMSAQGGRENRRGGEDQGRRRSRKGQGIFVRNLKSKKTFAAPDVDPGPPLTKLSEGKTFL